MNILAIDPGSKESGWVVMDAETLKPLYFGKDANEIIRGLIYTKELIRHYDRVDTAVIEHVASYGMAVGKEVFETCEWIGRFTEAFARMGIAVNPVYRKDEKMTLCGSMKAKDANIRRALIDRFAQHDMKNGKGTKDNPDWFYGFKADIWQAYAAGVTWADMRKEGRTD